MQKLQYARSEQVRPLRYDYRQFARQLFEGIESPVLCILEIFFVLMGIPLTLICLLVSAGVNIPGISHAADVILFPVGCLLTFVYMGGARFILAFIDKHERAWAKVPTKGKIIGIVLLAIVCSVNAFAATHLILLLCGR